MSYCLLALRLFASPYYNNKLYSIPLIINNSHLFNNHCNIYNNNNTIRFRNFTQKTNKNSLQLYNTVYLQRIKSLLSSTSSTLFITSIIIVGIASLYTIFNYLLFEPNTESVYNEILTYLHHNPQVNSILGYNWHELQSLVKSRRGSHTINTNITSSKRNQYGSDYYKIEFYLQSPKYGLVKTQAEVKKNPQFKREAELQNPTIPRYLISFISFESTNGNIIYLFDYRKQMLEQEKQQFYAQQ
jgi:hypothetical protein